MNQDDDGAHLLRFQYANPSFAVDTSDSNRSPSTPAAMTRAGVPLSVRPMNPIRTPPISLIAYAGSTGSDFRSKMTFAARY